MLKELQDLCVKIVDIIGEFEEEQKGSFEAISDEERAELNKKSKEFNIWYEKLLENFEVDEIFPHRNQLDTIKNLVRHGYNANL